MPCAMESSSSAMDSSDLNSSAMDFHPPEKLHFAKEEKEIETVALVRVLNTGRLDTQQQRIATKSMEEREARLRQVRSTQEQRNAAESAAEGRSETED